MFYLLNKPKGRSSFAIINSFAKENMIKKIGHTGTLDPLASGLLLVATDDDTKLIPYIKHNNKSYVATIQFGKQTDTYDSEGIVINSSEYKLTDNNVLKVCKWLESQTEQIPPSFSAKKISGIRSYNLARSGKEVKLQKQPIKVFSAKIISFNIEKQQLVIYVDVSKGTYIRSLVNDLGLYLNTYAYMTELDRVKIGNLDISLLNGNGFVAISDNHLFSIPYYEPSISEINKLKNGINIINNKNIANGDYILKTKQINWGIISVDNEIVKVKKLFGKRINEIEKGVSDDQNWNTKQY
ncbi:tRNA pseudouridine(55) synthase TruB [Mycoplasmopsis bovis]|uniref:tRNA pseudouridine(55) synthase TruB n=1 Tax=Mycoplasmopsis bovis TaxID=28903 RepID=UPI00244E60E5|nr:tRNA pseudouridine(55) synthase TruB [Mycoplasmopsis bovis]